MSLRPRPLRQRALRRHGHRRSRQRHEHRYTESHGHDALINDLEPPQTHLLRCSSLDVRADGRWNVESR